MNFDEQNTESYNWDQGGVYVIEPTDYVEGGEDGVSNRQAKELTRRTRNLHSRMTTAQGEIDTLQEQLPIATEAALRTSKEYTDGKDTVLRNDMAVADTAALSAAKAYADRVVAALVDNSPEALNTLQELATALGNDPNFATTVMQQIGERVKTTDFNNALAGKANSSHSHAVDDVPGVWHAGNFNPADKANTNEAIVYRGVNANSSIDECEETGYYFDTRGFAAGTLIVVRAYINGYHPVQMLIPFDRSGLYTRSFNTDAGHWSPWVEMYHSGNLVPATTTANGLMSAADKTKLDGLSMRVLASGKIGKIGGFVKKIGPYANQLGAPQPTTAGVYRITHNFGDAAYTTIITPCERYEGTWSLSASVVAEMPTYIEINITENEYLKNSSFNFMIVGTL